MLLAPESIATTAFSAADAARLSDDELVNQQRDFAAARRLLDAGAAAVSAEIARRSAPELGYAGLAQSRGARTPEALVQQLTGLSVGGARTLVSVGNLVAAPPPGLEPLASAVTAGGLSLEGAAAIQSALGDPGRVSEDKLALAAARLVQSAAGLSLERLVALARETRDALDLAGVPEREEQRRDRRFLSLRPLPDGMTRLSGLLDPESAAIVTGAIDAITSPRRGGPRFVDAAATPEPATPDDVRSIPQLMLDALVDIVQLASQADQLATEAGPGTLFGKRRVAVRVHVAERDLRGGQGFAHIEGQTAAVAVSTAERIACDTGMLPLLFDTDGQVVNVGREQRYHTSRQRIGLAARDGGCTVDGCERPPHFCEVHHVDEWLRDHGETSIRRAVLLCRHHHLLVHNNGWRIEDDGHANYTMCGPRGERRALRPQNPIAARVTG